MQTTKKVFLAILVLLLIAGTCLGAFYFFKKYFTQSEVSQPTVTTMASTSPEAVIPGFKQDSSMNVPTVFPQDLVVNEDILFPIASFTVTQDSKTQYTFKYQSKNTFSKSVDYFNAYLNSKEWRMIGKPSSTKTSAFLTARNMSGNELIVTINSTNGVVIDITYIQ